MVSISGQGTKILHVVWSGQNEKREREQSSFPRWAGLGRNRTWWVEGKPDSMPCSHAPWHLVQWTWLVWSSVSFFSFCPDLSPSLCRALVSTAVVSQEQRPAPPWVCVSPPTAVQPRVSPKASVIVCWQILHQISLEQLLSSWTLLCSLFRGAGRRHRRSSGQGAYPPGLHKPWQEIRPGPSHGNPDWWEITGVGGVSPGLQPQGKSLQLGRPLSEVLKDKWGVTVTTLITSQKYPMIYAAA